MPSFARRLSFIFLITLLFTLGSVNFAFACTCFSANETFPDIDGTEECSIACSFDEDARETGDGECLCSDGTSVEISCDTTCNAAGYTHEPPGEDKEDYIEPELNVDIPGLKFSEIIAKNGVLEITWLGDYVSGLYTYLVGIGAMIAIVMIMIGGLQYTFAAGSGDTGKAKKRINNAVIGFVLLLCVYMIMFLVNPNLVFFDAVKLLEIDEVELDLYTAGGEGVFPAGGGREVCDAIVEDAKENGSCDIKQAVISPTGGQPGCGNHHWFDYGANGDFRNINNLDYGAGWGTVLYAPITGTVTYKQQTDNSNRCGNRVTINGTGDAAGASLTICHMKDFVNETGSVYPNGTEIEQGKVIGHIGGNCCAGENPPDSWSASKRGWCDVSGTACSSPWKEESCACQSSFQAGNTSGPHVHITWNSGGDLLNCLDY